jgi:hypothetical protein
MCSEDLVVDKDGGVRWALVYVSKGLGSERFEVPKEPVTLTLSDCRYAPHVVGIRALQELLIVNGDHQNHRTAQILMDGTRGHDWPLEPRGRAGIRFSQGPLYVMAFCCDLHPWESAWVGVCGHPFFAVSGDRGQYEIPNLPSGSYTLAVWHERYTAITREFQVSDDSDASIDLELSKERR